tara:strand:+ start:784 stop:972 length:189 start_codon:yes stop_codon:yes gene_type:complete
MSLKKITVKVDLIVDESVDAEDLVLCCDYSFSDFEKRIQSTQLSGYTVKSASGEILEDVEAL